MYYTYTHINIYSLTRAKKFGLVANSDDFMGLRVG